MVMPISRRRLLAALDKGRVEAAIRHAEELCAFELRVSIAGPFWGAPRQLAERAFRRMAMAATSQRNGVLVFVAPWRRQVVIVADEGIAAKVDARLWSDTVAVGTDVFRTGHFTEGLIAMIEGLARALAPHLPPGRRANELPDTIER
jgi:hypothetical protein